MMVGGRPAIRGDPVVKSGTVHTVDGKIASSSQTTVPNASVYVPLNDTGVLTVSSPSGSTLGEVLGKPLTTLTFAKQK